MKARLLRSDRVVLIVSLSTAFRTLPFAPSTLIAVVIESYAQLFEGMLGCEGFRALAGGL